MLHAITVIKGYFLTVVFSNYDNVVEISTTSNTMKELSLQYYLSICKNNAELLETFKTLLLKDFKTMDVRFFSAVGDNNIIAMRRELHNMYPIVFNLKFSRMLTLIDRYRHCDAGELAKLHVEMRLCLAKIYELLAPVDASPAGETET